MTSIPISSKTSAYGYRQTAYNGSSSTFTYPWSTLSSTDFPDGDICSMPDHHYTLHMSNIELETACTETECTCCNEPIFVNALTRIMTGQKLHPKTTASCYIYWQICMQRSFSHKPAKALTRLHVHKQIQTATTTYTTASNASRYYVRIHDNHD